MSIDAKSVFEQHMTPEQRATAAEMGATLVAEYKSLSSLRKAFELTQSDVAIAFGVSQDNISRLEQRGDFLVSTLRRYVQSMGGELQLTATFDGAEVSLSKILQDEEETSDKAARA